MSLAVLRSRALAGMEAPPVTVGVHLANGLHGLTNVGTNEYTMRAGSHTTSDATAMHRPRCKRNARLLCRSRRSQGLRRMPGANMLCVKQTRCLARLRNRGTPPELPRMRLVAQSSIHATPQRHTHQQVVLQSHPDRHRSRQTTHRNRRRTCLLEFVGRPVATSDRQEVSIGTATHRCQALRLRCGECSSFESFQKVGYQVDVKPVALLPALSDHDASKAHGCTSSSGGTSPARVTVNNCSSARSQKCLAHSAYDMSAFALFVKGTR
jgi:hypothetical protein